MHSKPNTAMDADTENTLSDPQPELAFSNVLSNAHEVRLWGTFNISSSMKDTLVSCGLCSRTPPGAPFLFFLNISDSFALHKRQTCHQSGPWSAACGALPCHAPVADGFHFDAQLGI